MSKGNRKKSGYARKRKAETADRYGQFKDGRRLTADVIAGRRIGDA
jgi:hypothetical protein